MFLWFDLELEKEPGLSLVLCGRLFNQQHLGCGAKVIRLHPNHVRAAGKLAAVNVEGIEQVGIGARRGRALLAGRGFAQRVHRAARLVEHNRERFAKRILASPRTRGEVRLLRDSGDEASRARLLLRTWWTEGTSDRYAILARTNRELVPYAAVATELGIAYRCVEDGLLLDDERVEAVLGDCDPAWPLLPALAAACRRA